MAYIFASNPDALAQQQNFYDTTNIQLAQRDQALRQKAEDDAREAYIFSQRQQQENDRQAAAQAMQYQSQQAAEADRAAQMAQSAYQFGTGQKNLAEQSAEQKRQFDIKTAVDRETIAANKALQGEQRAAKDVGDLLTSIQQGEVTSPDQIDTVFSHLSDDERKRGKVALLNKQQGLMDDWKSVSNQALAATGLVAPAPVAPPPPHWWSGAQPIPPAVKLTEEDAMKKLMSSNNKTLLSYAPLLSWNEDAQKFQPITKPPAYLFSAGAQGLTNAPPSAVPSTNAVPPMPLRAPPLLPATNAPPAYSFPTNAPVQMNLPPAAVNIPAYKPPPVTVAGPRGARNGLMNARPGQTLVQNGNTFRFDGQNWVFVK